MSGRLLTEVHAQLASAGIALATLWPSSIAPYARVGYAPAGQRLRHSLPLAHLPQRGGDDVVRETEPTDALASCYESFARANSGMFARGPSDWRRLMTGTDTSPVQVWSARRAGAVVGYVVLTQETASGPMPFTWSQRDGHYNYDLICRDLVWSDAEAARSLLGFLAGFAPMAQVVHWTGPMHDPLVTLLRGQQPAVSSAYRWMSCLLDVPVALRARGWPADATCDVVLTVQGQSQQYGLRLRVAGGDAVVDEVPTGTTAVTVDAGALAALYTGWLSPADAVRTGQLRGTTPKDVSSLTACLAGPSPWTLDFF
jgi:predicted acetyltransferase